jgi:hypothetical protein
VNQFVFEPDANFESLPGNVRDQVELDIFPDRDMRDLDLVIEESDTAIAIHGAHLAQAEDVLGRGIRLWQGKGTEEAGAGFLGVVEADAGDLTGGGMDLMVVVTVDLIP